MGTREISQHQRQWLDRELAVWSREGILHPGQADQILGCYESVAASGHRKQSRARFALQAVSAFLVGLAVLLVIGYNWEGLDRVAKLLLIFGSIAGIYLLAFYLRQKTPYRHTADIAFFLGCLLYGAGIWLVAQVFHLDSHYPDGVWWWAVGVLPLALCLDSLLIHVLYVGLLALWAGMEVTGFSHLSPWLFWKWWPNGAYSLPLLAAPGLIWAYRRNSPAAVALYAPLVAWWVVLQAIAWDLDWRSIYLVGTVGAIFLIVAENHRHGSRLAIPYRLWGTLMIAGALIPPSFHDFHRETRNWHGRYTEENQLFVVAVMVVFAALVAFAFLLRPLGLATAAHPLVRLQEVLKRQWIPFGLVAAMAAMALLSFGDDTGIVAATIIANVAMVALAIWMMRVGLREERGRLFAFGVLYFLCWSVFRYMDLFGEMGGMLGAALMFFLCGALLFALATLWGKRRELRHA